MKRFFLSTIFLLAVSAVAYAETAASRDSLWNSAVAAYSAADYPAALEGFLALEREGVRTPDLYYNIGNAYYKCGHHVGKSIIYYERALKADPSFEDARNNLAMARTYALDKIDTVPEFVLFSWLKAVRSSLPSDTWAVLCLVMFVACLISMFFFRFGSRTAVKKWFFGLACLFIVLAGSSFGFSLSQKFESERTDKAVVMVPVSSAKSSPNNNGQSLFVIHEGTDVNVLDELGEWSRIELSDGRQGWIVTKDIEII